MMKIFPVTVLVFALFGISACGKKDDPAESPATTPQSQSLPSPKDLQGMPPEKRDVYCFLDVEPETKDGASTFINMLGGTWTHYPAGSSDDRDRMEFNLDTRRGLIAITDYFEFGHNVQNMNYGKVCVSKALGPSAGAFEGFRVFQLMSSENEGAAAFLLKIIPSNNNKDSRAILKATDYYYTRFGSYVLKDLSTLLQSSSATRIWTYTDRK